MMWSPVTTLPFSSTARQRSASHRCVDCGELYTTRGIGNELVCTQCSSRHAIDTSYRFTDDTKSIPRYYDMIKELEEPELDTFRLQTRVHTTVFASGTGKKRKETGECTLTPEGFAYRSDNGSSFTVPMKDMSALAFSCGQEFELYSKGDLYYFYPDENRAQCARWALLVDMINERKRNRTHEES